MSRNQSNQQSPNSNGVSMARNQPVVAGSNEIPQGHASAAMPSRRAVIRTAAADPHIAVSAPNTVNVLGRSLIPPQSSFARAIVGSSDNLRESSLNSVTRQAVPSMAPSNAPPPGMSGLSVLLNQQQQQQSNHPYPSYDLTRPEALEQQSPTACEADSASGPPPDFFSPLGSSAPGHLGNVTGGQGVRRSQNTAPGIVSGVLARQHSVGAAIPVSVSGMAGLAESKSDRVRRYVECFQS